MPGSNAPALGSREIASSPPGDLATTTFATGLYLLPDYAFDWSYQYWVQSSVALLWLSLPFLEVKASKLPRLGQARSKPFASPGKGMTGICKAISFSRS